MYSEVHFVGEAELSTIPDCRHYLAVLPDTCQAIADRIWQIRSFRSLCDAVLHLRTTENRKGVIRSWLIVQRTPDGILSVVMSGGTVSHCLPGEYGPIVWGGHALREVIRTIEVQTGDGDNLDQSWTMRHRQHTDDGPEFKRVSIRLEHWPIVGRDADE